MHKYQTTWLLTVTGVYSTHNIYTYIPTRTHIYCTRMAGNWSSLNRRCFQLVENLLRARSRRIKDFADQGCIADGCGLPSSRSYHLSTTCCIPERVSIFVLFAAARNVDVQLPAIGVLFRVYNRCKPLTICSNNKLSDF